MKAVQLVAAMAAPFLLGAAAAPTPARTTCGWNGATYVAKLRPGAKGAAYRLQVQYLPRGAEGAAVAMRWRFQTLSASGGKVVSELAMDYGCPNGDAPCSVAPRSRPGAEGGLYSEVVALDRDFAPAGGDDAPYALVLPGFASDDWTFTRAELAMPELRFATAEQVTPDLSDRLVWLRSACGRR